MKKPLRLLPAAIISALIMSVLLTTPGCKHKETASLREHARNLYHQTALLTLGYTDSILNAKDSTSLLALAARYEDRLVRVNFSVPANTDLEVSESENDTLAMLAARYVEVRDSMLYRFAHPLTPADSLSDSIPAPTAMTTVQKASQKTALK